ncbi:MAG: cytochrome d ubiquinol oxidase subunit II [Bacteroidales bacterium]|nr:cytochrome d ubiquinol oxidase subunit II [Bacteroidales bacterium]HPD95006.1 cytochrome d ubiquinol oxidase subunit II [Tenuifilaceae bacterium]HRX30451.1 cytochrome d ubiquinol oxidase subunit II [Tenuifilaceae bacterium]
MTDTTYILLQHYWWFIISLLGAILVFLLFVQGGQTLIYTLGKNKTEQTLLVNALGRKWEFTFTTLVTFGGAFFASFPLFYSTSFGGAYWVWMAILFCFIIQAISYEYRSKPSNFLGQRTYDAFLFVNGFLGTILLGIAVATFFTGSEFSVNKLNLANSANTVISSWETPWHGLEAALNLHNLSLGLAVFFLARVLATLYFMNTIDNDEIFKRSRKQLLYNAIPFLVFFLTFVIWLMLRQGFAVNPSDGTVFMENFKYFHNLIQMPIVLIIFLAGVVLVLWGIAASLLKTYTKGIWFTGFGTVLAVLALFLIAGYNNTAYYPSTFDLQSSLTIYNSSSSKFTLTAMSIVSILIPFVIAYIWYAWKSINVKKINEEEINNESHVY